MDFDCYDYQSTCGAKNFAIVCVVILYEDEKEEWKQDVRTIEISGPGSNRGPGQRSQELNYEQYEEHTVFVDMRPSTLYVVHSSVEILYEEHCIVEEKSKGWLNVIALYVPRPHCSTFETFD